MKKEKGQALVEFGLMLFALLLILIFIFGAVFTIHNYLVLDRAVAKAGRYGSLGATDAQIIEAINITTREALVNTPILAGRFHDDQIHIEVYDSDGNLVESGGRDDFNDVIEGNRLKITLFYEIYFAVPYIDVFHARIPVSETVRIEQPVGGWTP